MAKVKEVLQALDDLTGGRCVKDPSDWSSGKNRFVVTKTSNIPGKSCTEIPGLVWGDPEMEVRKIAVCMTVTESVIELAAATGVNAIISHHPRLRPIHRRPIPAPLPSSYKKERCTHGNH